MGWSGAVVCMILRVHRHVCMHQEYLLWTYFEIHLIHHKQHILFLMMVLFDNEYQWQSDVQLISIFIFLDPDLRKFFHLLPELCMFPGQVYMEKESPIVLHIKIYTMRCILCAHIVYIFVYPITSQEMPIQAIKWQVITLIAHDVQCMIATSIIFFAPTCSEQSHPLNAVVWPRKMIIIFSSEKRATDIETVV